MKVLLDECVDRGLRAHLQPHVVTTVVEAGWSGLTNGELLDRAANRFDVFLTVDQNLRYQQNLQSKTLPVLLVVARRNSLQALLPLVPEILRALERIKPGQLVVVGS